MKRSLLYPILESFDLAETDRPTPVRFSTTQPTQALGMLNGQFLNKQAALFAQRLQKDAGGDLAEILDKIGYVVRERYRILGQVKALTGEGRLSGIVLIGLPFALFVMMLHIKPDYVAVLWTDPLGIKMAVAGLIMQILGAIVIKKIVNIKV